MILSPDQQSLYLAVPKTGSTTMEFLLKNIPGAISMDENIRHGLPGHLRLEVEAHPELYPNVNLDTIKCYAFWRDPVTRLFSSCNYVKRFPLALSKLFPDRFGDLQIPILNPQRRWTVLEWNNLPEETKTAVRGLTVSDFMSVNSEILGVAFFEQTHWVRNGEVEVEILRFEDFQNEARRLITIFGGDPNVTIPSLNAADSFPAYSTYVNTLDTYMAAYGRYNNDYMYMTMKGIPWTVPEA